MGNGGACKDLPPLVTMGDPRLARPSLPVARADIGSPAFQDRLGLLRKALTVHGANGVAAPQLGWFERAFVMRDPSGSGDVVTWVNPEIVTASEDLVWYWEGCLSVPGLKGYMGRSAAIAVAGYDEQGERVGREFTDWEAHLFQHEFDHLDGILFPYKVTDPRHVVSAEELERREEWPPGWPVAGAREAPIRVIAPAGGNMPT